MEIYNKEEHKSCYCFENEDNSLVKLLEIEHGESKSIRLRTNEIVFMMEGSILFALCGQADGTLNKGQFIFLPVGEQFCYRADTLSTVLILRLTDHFQMCPHFSLKQLYYRIKEQEKPENPFPLEINTRLHHFAQGLIETYQDGLKCKLYFRHEISKLLIMLPVYYPKEALYRFFYPMINPDTTFWEYVRTNHLKHRTVNEFADAMNMTAQQFTRRFNNVFGQSPYEWMQQQRARLVFGEICQSNKPLKEIAADFGFTDQSNFNRFCRTFFDTTPGKMRKNKP